MDIFETIVGDAEMADREMRVHDIVKQWEVIPQGDCNMHHIGSLDDRGALEKRVQKYWPDFRLGKLGKKVAQYQLVPGHSIGSRHVIAERDRMYVEVYAPGKDASPLVGPTIVASSRFTVEHPEHAAHSIPSGVYQVLYQRDVRAEMARLAD